MAAVADLLKLDTLTARFLGVLAENRRLAQIAPVTRAFRALAAAHRGAVFRRPGISVGEVRTAEPRATDPRVALALDQVEVGAAGGLRARDDAIGDGLYGGVHRCGFPFALS